MSEPKTMIPAHAATQNVAPSRDVQVVERVRRPPLAEEERDRGGESDEEEPERERLLVRDGHEVDRDDERADEDRGENPAEVVDRIASTR